MIARTYINRDLGPALIGTMIASFYLTAQFFIDSGTVSHLYHRLYTGKIVDYDLTSTYTSLFINVISILAVVLYFRYYIPYSRGSLYKLKMSEFHEEMKGILRYHNNVVEYIHSDQSIRRKTNNSEYRYIFVDAILADLRSAFSILLSHEYIRLSLFVLGDDEAHRADGQGDHSEPEGLVVKLAQRSAFEDSPQSVTFKIGQGYAGTAALAKKAVYGNAAVSGPPEVMGKLGRKCAYTEHSPANKNMSFLAVPLLDREGTLLGVIAVDSRIKTDFYLSESTYYDLIKTINTIGKIITRHLLDGRFRIESEQSRWLTTREEQT